MDIGGHCILLGLAGGMLENGRRARRVPAMTRLWPGRLRGQRHQDRLDIAAGLEAEQGAAVVEQVELDIAAAADQLVAALLVGPRLGPCGARTIAG